MLPTSSPLDPVAPRADFPALAAAAGAPRPVAYLDAASTTPRPRQVIEAVARTMSSASAGVRRGVHAFSLEAERILAASRLAVARLLNAADPREVVFTRSATSALNGVARGLARTLLRAGDEVLVTELEHHSNLLPWRDACEASGARLCVAPAAASGELRLDALGELIGSRTRLVALAHVAPATGEVLPVHGVIERAHAAGALVVVDGALALGHIPVDVRALGCDFYVAAGHKAYGPAGTGILHGAAGRLERLPPLEMGGDMVLAVRRDDIELAPLPERHEAGSPNVEGAAGLAAAAAQLQGWGLEAIAAHEAALVRRAQAALAAIPGVAIVAPAAPRAGILSFTVEGVHPHDLATLLDASGVLVRAGNLCSQPLLERLGLLAATRASFGAYSTAEDVDRLVRGVEQAIETFR